MPKLARFSQTDTYQMKHTFYCLVLGCIVLLQGCSPAVTTSQGSNTNPNKTPADKYKENSFVQELSAYRPAFSEPITPQNTVATPSKSIVFDKKEASKAVNKRLDPILDTLAARNKGIKYANGFRIQIYVGNDKRAADEAKIFTYQTFPEIFPYLVYQQPVYKVKVGDFLNRMDAERYCATIRDSYPSAMILPDKVEIKKSMLVK